MSTKYYHYHALEDQYLHLSETVSRLPMHHPQRPSLLVKLDRTERALTRIERHTEREDKKAEMARIAFWTRVHIKGDGHGVEIVTRGAELVFRVVTLPIMPLYFIGAVTTHCAIEQVHDLRVRHRAYREAQDYRNMKCPSAEEKHKGLVCHCAKRQARISVSKTHGAKVRFGEAIQAVKGKK